MKEIIISFTILLLLNTPNYAQKINKVVYSEKTGSYILLGCCNRDGFAQEGFREWFDTNYESYVPDSEVIKKLSVLNNDDLIIEIVLGTWCSDSRREVPEFFKVIDEMGFSDRKIKIICVNREKKFPGRDLSKLNITHVPIFIIYKSGKETGRIIETPINSLEKDLFRILSYD